MIQELNQQGVYRGDIAERLGVHRKTPCEPAPSSKRRRERTQVKPYMETVEARLFNAWSS